MQEKGRKTKKNQNKLEQVLYCESGGIDNVDKEFEMHTEY